MDDKKYYKLKFDIATAHKGDIISYEQEWNTWYLNGFEYNHRGNIEQGEVMILLNHCVKDKLECLLEPYQKPTERSKA